MDLLKVAVVGKAGKGPKYIGRTVAGWSALFYATAAVWRVDTNNFSTLCLLHLFLKTGMFLWQASIL